MKTNAVLALSIALVLAMFPDFCLASTAGGGLPYESWLNTLRASVSGPVAYTVAIIGIIGAGTMLIWGGELTGFLKVLVYIVLVIGLLIGANGLLNVFGGGAELASVMQVIRMV